MATVAVIDVEGVAAALGRPLTWSRLDALSRAASDQIGTDPAIVVVSAPCLDRLRQAESDEIDRAEADGRLVVAPGDVDQVEVLVAVAASVDAPLISNRTDPRLISSGAAGDDRRGVFAAIALPDGSHLVTRRQQQSGLPAAAARPAPSDQSGASASNSEPNAPRSASSAPSGRRPSIAPPSPSRRGVAAIFGDPSAPSGPVKPRASASASSRSPSPAVPTPAADDQGSGARPDPEHPDRATDADT